MKKVFIFFILINLVSSQSKQAMITLYRDGFGLVKQPISFKLSKGRKTFSYPNIPDKMEVDSPFLSLSKGKVIYQSYNRDIFDTFNYLKDHLGEPVTITPVDGKTFKGNLLDVDDGWITVEGRKSIRIFNTREVVQISISDNNTSTNVRTKLSWEVSSNRDGFVVGELVYISRGFDWDAGYRLIVSAKGTRAVLISQAVLKNETDLDFTSASIKLVEGKLHRVTPSIPRRRTMARSALTVVTEKGSDVPPPPSREELGDYHIYTISERLTFPKNESITVTLQPDRVLEISRLYLFENNERSSKEEPLVIQISFRNEEKNKLGIPLPAGKLQIYRKLADRSIEFAGEDRLKQVPVGEVAEIIAGRAFDVIGKRTVVNYDRKRNSEEAVISLEIKNKRGNSINVQLTEHIYGDWVIKKPSHNYKKTDAQTIQFDLTLPANSTEIVSYTYRKEWK